MPVVTRAQALGWAERLSEDPLDAELLGCPLRLTVGKRTLARGEVEVQKRRGRETSTVPLAGAAAAVAELWRASPE